MTSHTLPPFRLPDVDSRPAWDRPDRTSGGADYLREWTFDAGIIVEETPVLALGALLTHTLRVINPIPLVVTREQDQVVAHAPDLGEFGQGDNRSEAIADLQRSIADLFSSLKAESSRLGADLQEVWRIL